MCLKDEEQVTEGMDNLGLSDHGENQKAWSLHSELLHTQVENGENDSSSDQINLGNSFHLESICEDAAVANRRNNPLKHFLPALRFGEWSDIGGRSFMEDTHICIPNLAKNFGYNLLGEEAISFYGVFDGHGGKGAAQFVRDHLPRVIVEDADFSLELEKVVARSFMETDAAFAKSCSFESALSSGTTALTAQLPLQSHIFTCSEWWRLPGSIVSTWNGHRDVKRSQALLR